MKSQHPARPTLSESHVRRFALLAASLLLCSLVVGCPTEEPEPTPPTPVVAVAGTHALQIGTTLQLSASTTDGTDAGYSWSSSDASFASVDATGLVTGVAVGEAVITVAGDDTGASATHGVVVTAEPVVADVTVTVGGAFYLAVGGTAALTASTTNASDSAYGWSVDDATVATVDDDGVLTGIAPGTVTVTATGADTAVSGALGVVVAMEIPHLDEWSGSAHADVDAEAFHWWDEDGSIPPGCARCHSTPGFQAYTGADGSEVGVVENDAPLGTVITCEACHNAAADALDTVTFPSGVTVDGLGPEARCMTCHQGRASTDSVDAEILDAAPADDDTIDADLGFVNIHYYPAGATILAGIARGGYQYDGETYDVRFRHVDDSNSCVECHSPHTLQVEFETCATCHEGVVDAEDLRDVRMVASQSVDFDGDGDLTEGVYYELMGVRAAAMTALQALATQNGFPICFSQDAYPYYFNDTNSDGACDAAEAVYGNLYVSWTARLLRAAYNIQVATVDPGAFAHNAKYIIELLYDSAMDVNGALSAPADLSTLVRNDPGHFNGSGRAARFWDDEEAVEADCSKCHGGAEGFRFFLDHGVGPEVLEQGNGLECETCHDTFADVSNPNDAYALIQVDSFTLESGAEFVAPDNESNICSTCHSGRKTGADVDATIASGSLEFQNVHYLPAAGVRLGSEGGVGYEYGTNVYSGTPDNHAWDPGCGYCHDAVASEHSFEPADAFAAGACSLCHGTVADVNSIRKEDHPLDYDGDGDAAEPLADELVPMAALVLAKMNEVGGLCYAGSSYPYFFTGGDANGTCLAGEANYSNAFTGWTPTLLKASYNYQVWSKDPAAWAHNFDYMAQLLYDTYADLGGDPAAAGWTRPPL